MRKEELIDKIGNTLIYFSKNMPSLSKTKALKLIYLLDEFSISRYGIPFFNLEYEAWKFGPVNQELYSQLDSNDTLASLKEYINIEKGKNNTSYIKTKRDFNDDEFSDNDIKLLEDLTKTCRKRNADNLVKITHRKNGLWHQVVEKHNLLEDFDNGIKNTSNFKINFHDLVQEDNVKSHLLKEYEELEKFSRSFNF